MNSVWAENILCCIFLYPRCLPSIVSGILEVLLDYLLITIHLTLDDKGSHIKSQEYFFFLFPCPFFVLPEGIVHTYQFRT